MKKLLLSTAILVASLTASAQELIQHGDFKGVTSVTPQNELLRIAAASDLGGKTQTTNPTAGAETVVAGTWYKKAGAKASLHATILDDVQLGGKAVSAANMVRTETDDPANQNQNQLLQFVSFEENVTYELQFDIKAEEGSNAEAFYVEVRTFIDNSKTQLIGGSSNVSFSDAAVFSDLGNGWFHYSKKFKAAHANLTADQFAKSFITISKDSKNLPYSYFVANVSLKPDQTVGLGSANESKAKVYATGKTVRVENANGTVSVYNVAGQLVKQLVCQENVSFDLSSKGVFVVKVQEANAAKTVKIAL
ncbi:MAG: T9SS type A sorting domain-containing protein [Bacteroidales bacterium]